MRIKQSSYRLFPVYTSKHDQVHRICGIPCSEVITVTDTAYPPFQLIFKEDQGNIQSTGLKHAHTDGVASVGMNYSVTKIVQDIDGDGTDEYIYIFNGAYYQNVLGGFKYLEFKLNNITYYTEVYYHPGSENVCGDKWWLDYSHCCDNSNLGLYSNNFINTLYLGDILISRTGEAESITTYADGFGRENVASADVKPIYSIEILGNNWLFDSLYYLKLYDNVVLRRGDGMEAFKIFDIQIQTSGDVTECQFPIRISFTREALDLTKCCDSVYENAPLPGNCAGMSVSLPDDFTVCAGEEVELSAQVVGGAGPYIFVWSNGHLGQTLTIELSETTTLTVVAIDAFGCVKSAEIEVATFDCSGELIAEITGPENACPGDEVELTCEVDGEGTYEYLWSTGATTATITVTPTNKTNVYSCIVTHPLSGNTTVVYHTVYKPNIPNPTIFNDGCTLMLVIGPTWNCESLSLEWQIESSPGVWEAAPGPNSGPTYTGVNGSNYRLKRTCDTCVAYSNEINMSCPSLCSAEITSIEYSIGDGLEIQWEINEGTTPFVSAVISVYEKATTDDDCDAVTAWELVDNFVVTTLTGTIPGLGSYSPPGVEGCIMAVITVNGTECSHTMKEHLVFVGEDEE